MTKFVRKKKGKIPWKICIKKKNKRGEDRAKREEKEK